MALRRDVVDGAALRGGAVAGPVLVFVGYLVVLTGTDLIIDDRGLLAIAVWPAAAALVAALVVPGQRRRWVSAALGCLLGTFVVVAVVAGAIAGLAGLLSDPAPPAP